MARISVQGVQIRYATADPKRQTIPWVEYRNRNTSELRTYLAQDAKPNLCGSCHNTTCSASTATTARRTCSSCRSAP